MALKNHPEISENTAKRIREIAEKLGYRPDPNLSKIAAARWQSHKVSTGTALAFVGSLHPDHLSLIPADALEHPSPYLTGQQDQPSWTQLLPGHLQFQGARKRAHELGYELHYFLLKPGDDAKSLSRILYHRGIQGVILSPVFDHRFIKEFNWRQFATVAVADHYYLPPTDCVVPKLSLHILQAFCEFYRRGYKRPGLVLYHEKIQHLNNHILRGVFLSLCESSKMIIDAPPAFYIQHGKEDEMMDWIGKYQPDVVVGFNDYVYETLKKFHFQIPAQGSFVSLATKDPEQRVSGVKDPDFMLGYTGVDVLDFKIKHGIWGESSTRNFHTIQTEWVEGKTLSARTDGADGNHEVSSDPADFLRILSLDS